MEVNVDSLSFQSSPVCSFFLMTFLTVDIGKPTAWPMSLTVF
uniref:Uncharacterized protein n=1 Tax=Anguilla anguilla TaxID=7936 RepID=A0A0E9SFE2_ANGAN